MAGVLEHLNRQAARIPVPGPCRRLGLPLERRADASIERWWPQGITTSADATDPRTSTAAAAGHQLVLQGNGGQPREPDHGRRHRHPGVPARAAGRAGTPTSGQARAAARCWCTPAAWSGAGPTSTSPAPGEGCSAAWSTTSSASSPTATTLRLPLRAARAVRLRRRRERGRGADALLVPLPGPGTASPQLVAGEYGARRHDPAPGPLPARPRDLPPRRARRTAPPGRSGSTSAASATCRARRSCGTATT